MLSVQSPALAKISVLVPAMQNINIVAQEQVIQEEAGIDVEDCTNHAPVRVTTFGVVVKEHVYAHQITNIPAMAPMKTVEQEALVATSIKHVNATLVTLGIILKEHVLLHLQAQVVALQAVVAHLQEEVLAHAMEYHMLNIVLIMDLGV